MNGAKFKHIMSLIMALTLTLILPASLTASTVTSFDDITYWVGSGSNKAAIAIDWFGDDASDAALVWGYRWNGNATGEQMLRDVLADDKRFFARMSSGGPMGVELYGFGYDENNDGEFALDDNTMFNADGIAITGSSDGAEAGLGDRYREGWSSGYWHYGVASGGSGGQPNSWISSGVGVTTRLLEDGDWDSHAFAVTLNGDEFATNLIAAEPSEMDLLPGDFNGNGSVDAADYTVWRDGLGTTHILSQYHEWLTNFGLSNSSTTTTSIPEPATAMLVICFFATHFFSRHGQPL